MRNAFWPALLATASIVSVVPSAAFGAPMRCDVSFSSVAGGTVRVATDETPEPYWFPEANKPYVAWSPPPAPTSPRLVVGYTGATLMGMGNEPSGGHIRFRISPPTEVDDTQVILSTSDGSALTLQGDDLRYGSDFGSDDETRPAMDVAFTSRLAGWPAIRSALTKGGWLRVKLVRNGEPMLETLFDFSNLEARDSLLDMARDKVVQADPTYCTREPRPTKRWY